MAGQDDGFFKITSLTPEEKKIVETLYEVSSGQDYVRIGPVGYTVMKNYAKYAAEVYNMELRSGDVFVTGYPRSGTTLTQELVWLVASDLDYEKARATILNRRYAFISLFSDQIINKDHILSAADPKKAREIKEHMSMPAIELLAGHPSPRFVKTHLPLSLLPPALLDKAKVVYVARDPRDVIVSMYHFTKLFKAYKFKGTFKQLWNAYLKDLCIFEPFFEHVKEAWALRNHANMLFLFYEDLSEDLPASIRRVSDFFGKKLDENQIKQLCEHLSIENFKNNKSVNNEHLRETGCLDINESFIRKGKTGGWREYFDEAMRREAQEWITHNLRDTDLRFPSMQEQ